IGPATVRAFSVRLVVLSPTVVVSERAVRVSMLTRFQFRPTVTLAVSTPAIWDSRSFEGRMAGLAFGSGTRASPAVTVSERLSRTDGVFVTNTKLDRVTVCVFVPPTPTATFRVGGSTSLEKV